MDRGSSTLAAEAMQSCSWVLLEHPHSPSPMEECPGHSFPLQPLPRGKQACQDVPTCLNPSLFFHLNPGTSVPHMCCMEPRNETRWCGDRCTKQPTNQQSAVVMGKCWEGHMQGGCRAAGIPQQRDQWREGPTTCATPFYTSHMDCLFGRCAVPKHGMCTCLWAQIAGKKKITPSPGPTLLVGLPLGRNVCPPGLLTPWGAWHKMCS